MHRGIIGVVGLVAAVLGGCGGAKQAGTPNPGRINAPAGVLSTQEAAITSAGQPRGTVKKQFPNDGEIVEVGTNPGVAVYRLCQRIVSDRYPSLEVIVDGYVVVGVDRTDQSSDPKARGSWEKDDVGALTLTLDEGWAYFHGTVTHDAVTHSSVTHGSVTHDAVAAAGRRANAMTPEIRPDFIRIFRRIYRGRTISASVLGTSVILHARHDGRQRVYRLSPDEGSLVIVRDDAPGLHPQEPDDETMKSATVREFRQRGEGGPARGVVCAVGSDPADEEFLAMVRELVTSRTDVPFPDGLCQPGETRRRTPRR